MPFINFYNLRFQLKVVFKVNAKICNKVQMYCIINLYNKIDFLLLNRF